MRMVGIFALTVGAAMVVGVLPLFIYESRPPRNAKAEIARFESDIEAWQDSLAYTATGADSVAIHERIAGRQQGIASLNYHLAADRVALEGWWRPAGPGGTLLIAGAFLAKPAGGRRAAEIVCTRLAGARAGSLVSVAETTIRSVVQGVVGVAIIQSVLAGLGMPFRK